MEIVQWNKIITALAVTGYLEIYHIHCAHLNIQEIVVRHEDYVSFSLHFTRTIVWTATAISKYM